jgi:hypothetical protein
MAEMNQEQRKKKAEFIGVTAEEIRLIREQLQKEFAQNAEGREAAFLRAVLTKQFGEGKLEAFIGYFVPKRKDGKVVDVKTQGVEYIKSNEAVKADADLVNKLDSLEREITKSNLPDLEEWKYYLWLLDETKKLEVSPNSHEFIKKLNVLLAKDVKYHETEIAKILSAHSLKTMPKIIAMENLNLFVSAMKLLLYRLYMPHQEAAAAKVIGSTERGSAALPLALEYLMASEMKISEDEFRKELGECFAQEKEDVNRVNILKFAANMAKDKNKDIFVRFFTDIGQRNVAAFLVKEFEGGKSDPKTVDRIAELITRIDNVKARENAELAAKKELESLLSKMIESNRQRLLKAREKLEKTLSDKAEDLEKTHAKILAEVRKMDEDMKSRVEKLAIVAAGAGEVAKSLSALEAQDAANFRRVTEILPVLFAKNILELVKLGKLDEATLNAEIARMRSTSTSEYVARTLAMVEDVAKRVLHGEIPGEAFDTAKAQVDALAKQLLPQLSHISEAQRRIDDQLIEQAEQYEAGQHLADDMIEEGNTDATKRARWLRKQGLPPERYRVDESGMVHSFND